MTEDQGSKEVDDDLYAFSIRYRPNNLSKDFYNARQELIGCLSTGSYGSVEWTPGIGDTIYHLTLDELDRIIRAHCATPEAQSPRNDYFVEYVPVYPQRRIKPEELSREQRARLMQLNTSLDALEEKLVREVGDILAKLPNADAENSDGLIRYYDCDIELDYLVGKDDSFFDEDNSGNSLVKRQLWFDIICTHYQARMEEGINWNEFENWEDHPMRDEVHCWLYHDLYDHANLGWENMLRIEEILVNVVIRLDISDPWRLTVES